jgi:hypothetical protein
MVVDHLGGGAVLFGGRQTSVYSPGRVVFSWWLCGFLPVFSVRRLFSHVVAAAVSASPCRLASQNRRQ